MINLNNFRNLILIIMPPLILVVGLVGNFTAFLVLYQKKLNEIGPRLIYNYLFIFDTVFILQIVLSSLKYSYELRIAGQSDLACKIYIYFSYVTAAISPWLQVFISLDKLVAIKFPSKRVRFRDKNNQMTYAKIIVILIFMFYSPFPFFIYQTNQSDLNTSMNISLNVSKSVCDFTSVKSRIYLNYLDFIVRVLVPFSVSITSTLLLIYFVLKLKVKIHNVFFSAQSSSFKQDVLFASKTIVLNLVFIGLNLPFSILMYVSSKSNEGDYFVFAFTLYLVYSAYACNFYIILSSNTLFRNQLFVILKIKSSNALPKVNFVNI